MALFAVVCASGIGDALILEVAAHHLRGAGHEVITYTNHLQSFGSWLPEAFCRPQPKEEEIEKAFADVDAILVQHDNTPKSRAILELKKPVYTFYTNYRLSKHGPLRQRFDFPFDEKVPMVENVKKGLRSLFSIDAASLENGLKPPEGLIYRRYPKRVAIHPTSALTSKNWPKKKFLYVAKWLEDNGYEPVFITAPSEQSEWGGPLFSSLGDLASFLYESGAFLGNDSGPGHLASYIKLPYLIIGKQDRQMELWRPGWGKGEILTAPPWVPNWKGLRIREKKWQFFITCKNVIKALKNNVLLK